MNSLKQGDTDYPLLELHFRSEYAGMMDYACHLLGSRALAEVAIQNTFVTALKKYKEYVICPKPVGWLYNTLKYKACDILRERRHRWQALLPLEASDAAAPWPEELALSCIFPEDDPDFQLLSWFYLYGYSIEELAQAFSISIGACKMRLKRARERLRHKYTEEL